MKRQIVQDFAVLEDSKIIQHDDKFLVVKAVKAFTAGIKLYWRSQASTGGFQRTDKLRT